MLKRSISSELLEVARNSDLCSLGKTTAKIKELKHECTFSFFMARHNFDFGGEEKDNHHFSKIATYVFNKRLCEGKKKVSPLRPSEKKRNKKPILQPHGTKTNFQQKLYMSPLRQLSSLYCFLKK